VPNRAAAFTGSTLAFRYTLASHKLRFQLHLHLTLNRGKQSCLTKALQIPFPCPFSVCGASVHVFKLGMSLIQSCCIMKNEHRDSTLHPQITVGTSIRTEFLCSRFVGPMLQLTPWPKELYLCSCAEPSMLQLAVGLLSPSFLYSCLHEYTLHFCCLEKARKPCCFALGLLRCAVYGLQ